VTGEKPNYADLSSVIFSATHTFQKGEIVLAARTRGGFCYASVETKVHSLSVSLFADIVC